MKRLTTLSVSSMIAALVLSNAVSAGSLADPVVEPAVIVADATSSSSGTALVAALALLMIVPLLD